MNVNTKIICDDYKVWVRTQRCIGLLGCIGDVVPHHLIARGRGNAKRNDFTCVPLCVKHHDEIHRSLEKFERNHVVDVWKQAAMLLIEFFADADRRATVKIKLSER